MIPFSRFNPPNYLVHLGRIRRAADRVSRKVVNLIILAVLLFPNPPQAVQASPVATGHTSSDSNKLTSTDPVNISSTPSEGDAPRFLQTPGSPDASKSTLSVTSPVPADGVQAATITATIRDADSISVPDVEVVFNISGDGTNLEYLNARTDADGVVMAQLTSTVPGAKSIRAYIVGETSSAVLPMVRMIVFTAGEISGCVFNDKNSNEILDAGELGIVGIPVHLQDIQGADLATTYTASDGRYFFDGLAEGGYQLIVEPTLEFGTANGQTTVDLAAFQSSPDHNFGLFEAAAVSGAVWDDVNQNGTRDTGELSLAGVSISGVKEGSTPQSTSSGTDGKYLLKVPAELPVGPQNFTFNALSNPITQGLDSLMFNYNFEITIPLIDPGFFPSNYDFEDQGYALDPTTYPANYNFELTNLGTWQSSVFYVVHDSHDGSYAAYKAKGSSGTLISPEFTIPADAQSLTWWWKSYPNVGADTYFYLVDSASGNNLVAMYSQVHTSGDWAKYSFNVTSYGGQAVKFKVQNNDTAEYVYLDDVRLEVNVPGWTISGSMTGKDSVQIKQDSHDGSYAAYKPIGTSGSLTSPAFTIPADAQSLTWWWKSYPNVGADTYFYLVDAETNQNLTAMYSQVHTSGDWSKYSFNVTPYRGQKVKFKVQNNDTNEYVYLDDVRLEVNVPGWTISGGMTGIHSVEIVQAIDRDGSYAVAKPTGTSGSLTSPAFTIPADAQSLTWWWKSYPNVGADTYFYLVDAETDQNLTVMYSQVHTSGDWAKYSFNVTSYGGQKVKFKVQNYDTAEYVYLDDVRLEVKVPGWTISGSMTGTKSVGITQSSHDSSYAVFKPTGTSGSLTSPAFTIPADAQSLTWWWKSYPNVGADTYFYLLDSVNGNNLKTMYSQVHTSGIWAEYNFNVTPYRGQTVKFKVQNNDTAEYVYLDDVFISPNPTSVYTVNEENLPGYKSSTADSVEKTLRGGEQAIINFGDFTIDLGQSSLSVNPATVTANGIASSLVTVTMKDGLGNPVPDREVRVESTGQNVTIDQPTLTTDALGQVTATIRSTTAQTINVKARDIAENTVLPDIKQVTFIAGEIDSDHSTVQAAPEYVSANGIRTATITIVLRDSNDNPIPGHQVAIAHDGTGITLNVPSDVSSTQGLVVATMSASAPQTVTLQVTDLTAGIVLLDAPVVEFVATDPDQSTATISQDTVVADGVAEAVITVTLKDGAGNPVSSKPVELTITGSGNTVNDQPAGADPVYVGDTIADGTVTARLSSTVAEPKAIHIAGQHISLAQTLQAAFVPGPVSPADSSLQIDPSTLAADGIQTADATVVLMDANGNRIAGHEINLNASGVSVQITLPSPAVTDANGELTAQITSTEVGTAMITAQDVTAGFSVGQPVELVLITGPTDAAVSTVEVTGESLIANGSDKATVQVTLKDHLGHTIPGHTVTLSVSGSGNTVTGPVPAITGGDGLAVLALASIKAEQKTLTIRDVTQNVVLSQKPVVTFVHGSISAQNSKVETNKNQVPADNSSTATITVTILDAMNNPLQGVPVTVSATGSADVDQPTTPTDSNGRTTAFIRDGMIETVSVSAVADGMPLTKTVSISFNGADLAVTMTGTAKTAPDGMVQYAISVKNAGDLAASDVSLSLNLEDGLTLESHTAAMDPTTDGDLLVWDLGSLDPTIKTAFNVVANVDPNITLGTVLTTSAVGSTSSLEIRQTNNTAVVSTTVVAAYGFTGSITPASSVLSLGGSVTYTIRVKNTGLTADTFDLAASGLDAGWVAFSPDSLTLGPGATADALMTVSVSACQSGATIPFSVSVTSGGTGQSANLAAQVVLDAKPQILVDAPKDASVSGATTVLFRWRTAPDTVGSLAVYPAGHPEQAQTYTTADGTSHSVQVDGLVRNQDYEWTVTAASQCGSSASTRHFRVGNGLVFTNHNQAVTINRDYDQRVSVGVYNQDIIPHTLEASVSNPYEDIIVSFVESGSADQVISLPPQTTVQVILTIHAQDASLENYELTTHLVADEASSPITDDAMVRVTVLKPGDFTIEEDTAAFNEVTLAKTYVIRNLGQAITDLKLTAVDPITGEPANIFLQPSLDHARLDTGQSIRVVAYPIFTQADTEPGGGQFSLAQMTGLRRSSVGVIDFDLQGSGGGNTIITSGSTTCPAGKQIYAASLNRCKMTFNTNDWYCTNRPRINTRLQTPAFLNTDTIQSLSIGLEFTPRNNVLPHSGIVNFNGQQIGSFTDTIPMGEFSFAIPLDSWNNGIAGMVTQNVELITQHNNSGHYVSSTGYHLDVSVGSAVTYMCAGSQEAAQQAAQATYSCNADSGDNPDTDVPDDSVQTLDQIKNTIKTIESDLGYEVVDLHCTQGDCVDPINTRTGEFSFGMPDLSIPTSAGNLVFQRAYSTGSVEQYVKPLGYGWTHNHDLRLIFPSDPGGMEGYLLYKDILGNQYLFEIEPDGSYSPGPGVLASIIKNDTSPTSYTLTTPEQAKLEFDERGWITSRADAQGHKFTYTYDEQSLLSRVSADDGERFITFVYDQQGRITSVVDHAGRTVSYGYDIAGNLVSSTDLLGREWTYTYDSGHRMTQIVDPSGKETVRTEYDMNGRAYRQFDGNGRMVAKLVYNVDGSTTVTDADGKTRTHFYNDRNVVTKKVDELNRKTETVYADSFRPTAVTNNINESLLMEWSADGKELLARTEPDGGRTEYTYDDLGNLVSTRDPLGHETTFTYNGKLLSSKTDAMDGTTTYTYTPEGYLAAESDPSGRITSYTYDSHGQRTSTTDPIGNTTTYLYDDLGRLIESADPRGLIARNEYDAGGQLLRTIRNYDTGRPQNDQNLYNIITAYAYDVRGNQISVTDTYGRITQYEYDDADRLVRTVDPAGHATTSTYDAAGRLIATTDTLEHVTRYTYDAAGRRLSTIDALGNSSGTVVFDNPVNTSKVTDVLGRISVFYYDSMGRTVKVVDPLKYFTTTTYDANGNRATSTDQLGRTTSYEYDALNRLIRTTDPEGGVTETVYDEFGRQTATIDALGNRTEYTFDDAGRQVAVTDPLDRVTRTEYDEYGRRSASVDAAGRRTTYAYDQLDRVIAVTDPDGNVTHTTYDALGNVTAQTDAKSHTTVTVYDELYRVVSTIDAGGNATTNSYDAAGNLIAETDALGNATTYTYDALNRRTAVKDASENTASFTYDSLGNLTDQTDPNGVVTHYEYDAMNRKVAVVQNYLPGEPADADTNVRTEYTYNAVGNRIAVRNPNGHITGFQYDALGRTIQKTDAIGNTWHYEYDLAGNRIAMTDGNGKTTHFTYDPAGQLTLIDYPDPDVDVAFTYTQTGQRATMTDGLGTTTWSYDVLGRLISTTDPFGKTVGYAFDAAGNRTGLTYPDEREAASSYDDVDRLTQVADWSGQVTEYDYDPLGRLLGILRPNGVDSAYAFNEIGQLTQLEHTSEDGNLAAYEYTYDAAGNRTRAVEHLATGGTGPTVTVTVIGTTGAPEAGRTVYAFDGATYTNYSKVTDASGKAAITLPDGSYRFRADVDGTYFWSGDANHCTIGSCASVLVTIPEPVRISILDSDGTPREGVKVYAFNGATYTNYNGTTDVNGQAGLRLPFGSYRFRADYNGTQFWSGPENHCSVPQCTLVSLRVTVPLTVTVRNTAGVAQSGLKVYVFDGTTYVNIFGTTDANGQVVFTLPEGSYRFRADYIPVPGAGVTAFWSGTANHCTLPGCLAAEIIVTTPLTVTVMDTDGVVQNGVKVYAFDGSTYTNFNATTDANGQAAFTLPPGGYRFRADYQGTQFWSGTQNHCTVPGCEGVVISVTRSLMVTVLDTDGVVQGGVKVYAFNGTTYTNFNATTDANGQAAFTLPQGGYRFRADYNGTQFWSGTQNHCTVPGCESVSITVTKRLVVTVQYAPGAPTAGVKVYVFDGSTYKNFNATTDVNGQAAFTLPQGSYRFRADYGGKQYWSGTQNHCTVPGCTEATVTVSSAVTVTVRDANNNLKPGLSVWAYNDSTYANVLGTTNAQGQATLYLPGGNYRFKTYTDGASYWSGAANHCAIPGCTAADIGTGIPVVVTVVDAGGQLQTGVNVWAFNGEDYSGYGAATDVQGRATMYLPAGDYRFRIDKPGRQFWSGDVNHCTVPGCAETTVTIGSTVTVTVRDANNDPDPGLTVWAYDGETYADVFGATNAQGEATLYLPAGNFRFKTYTDGASYWSDSVNHCTVPGCTSAAIATGIPVVVTVVDVGGQAQAGVNVWAFDGDEYVGLGGATDSEGKATLYLPAGGYRFRVDKPGRQFWSGEANHCMVPGCAETTVTIGNTVVVTVQDAGSNPRPDLTVWAYDGGTYADVFGTTNAQGEAVLYLPAGDYRFKTYTDGASYWSGDVNHCAIPGCVAGTITVGTQWTATPTVTATATDTPLPTETETPSPAPLPTDTATETPTAMPTETATLEPTQTATAMGYLPGYGKVLAVLPARLGGGEASDFSPVYRMLQSQTNNVIVTVQDTDGAIKTGLKVYVFDGQTYIGINATTDANGQAAFVLPDGSYRFRADFNGTQFWSDTQNHCAVPECTTATVIVTIPVTVTVLDTDGTAKEGLKVYAFDGTAYTNHSATTDATGAAVFTLLPGSYRFRADFNGTQFWSGAENHCAIPGCQTASVSTTIPVTVTVRNTDAVPEAGLKVYAFNGSTYTNHSATTDANGQAVFTLPQGSYRFRADLNGTKFWSGAENHCTLPGCGAVSIAVTKPVTVTVAGKTGNPYPGLRVYAFTGETYSGYQGTTDAAGKVALTMPAGTYRFRADYDGVQFWSSEMEFCMIPGCTAAAVILPGGLGQMDVTIDYEYDALNRLTKAAYSNGTVFQYTYDPAGNVLEYISTIDGQTITTTYEYNDANQMVAAQASNTEAVWQYTYDGNGSLVQSSPGSSPADGAKRYTYNVAGYLTKVEAYKGGWQDQAQMAYDGLGRRLEMTGYAEGQSVTTQYTFDDPLSGTGGQPLVASAAELETTYLYGLGPIAELTDSWAYSLPDGTNTPRQLTNAEGEITFTASYTPWGDILAEAGTGNLTFGYFGGIMDAATGLLYVGNGQYYDPSTGRFLTRGARSGQTNPYSPWNADASALLIAPLVLLSLVYSRKRGKRGKLDTLFILCILSISVGVSLAACGGGGDNKTTYYRDGFILVFEPATSPPNSPPGSKTEKVTVTGDPGKGTEIPETTCTVTSIPKTTPTPSHDRFDKVIFMCGVGDGSACAKGSAPLFPFREWAERNGYSEGNDDFEILDVDGCGTKLECANRAQTYMGENSNSRFLIIGHSAGGSAAIIAIHRGNIGSNIAGIALLDPAMDATLENGDVVNLQEWANGLPKPIFLGDSPEDGPDHIEGAIHVDYPNLNHAQLATRVEVVNDMVDRFGWSEMK